MTRRFRSRTLAGPVRPAGTSAIESQPCLLRTLFCLPWTRAAITPACHGRRFDSRSYGRRLAQLKSDLRDALTEVQEHEKEVASPLVQRARVALAELEKDLKAARRP